LAAPAVYALRRQRPMIKTYSPIIATTSNAITYSILFTSFVLQKKLVGRSAQSRLPLFKAIWARMAPPITAATVLLAPAINILFARYWNVTRIVDRWVYVLGGQTTRSEIFIHC
jgi:hypothetical protein